MSIQISQPESMDLKPKITVIGMGGAGGNAVNNMISANLEGVDFWIANTDAQAMESSLTNNRLQLGTKTTLGLGAGSHPEVGKQAAEESAEELFNILENTNMLFITAGMGGGTGTGSAPVIAKIAKERGILTVGVVTKPFHFEGARRMKVAELGLEELNKYVDTLIVIPNQNLFRIVNEKTTFAEAFKLADDVLHSGIRGITDLITMPGIINLDFADIRTVMSEMGKAMMGTGEAEGENRAVLAAEAAISNPLIDNSSMKGARGVLINITGGSDMTLFQVDAAANRIREEVDQNAIMIFGSAYNPALDGKLRVSVVATGIEGRANNSNINVKTHESIEVTVSTTALPRSAEVFSNTDLENPEILNNEEDGQEDDENTFIPPKPAELNSYPSFGLSDFTPSANDTASNLSNDEDVENDNESLLKQNKNAQETSERKKKEDLLDIPAFIRKKMFRL